MLVRQFPTLYEESICVHDEAVTMLYPIVADVPAAPTVTSVPRIINGSLIQCMTTPQVIAAITILQPKYYTSRTAYSRYHTAPPCGLQTAGRAGTPDKAGNLHHPSLVGYR